MESTRKKIIFAGLENSGKSSIIESFHQKFSFFGTSPTMGIKRSNLNKSKLLGFEFIAWDLGGQSKFRKSYLERKYQVFSNTSILVYLFDVQDAIKIPESLQYLSNILKIFIEIGDRPEILILFHKSDPPIRDSHKIHDIIDNLKESIQLSINNLSLKFFNTTIHDITSIITVFSQGIIRSLEFAPLISNRLKKYAQLTYSSAVCLLSEDLLIVGDHGKTPQSIQFIEKNGLRFVVPIIEMNNFPIKPDISMINFIIPSSENNPNPRLQNFRLFIRAFTTPDNSNYFIISLTQNKNTFKLTEKYLPELANQLNELIYMITM